MCLVLYGLLSAIWAEANMIIVSLLVHNTDFVTILAQ